MCLHMYFSECIIHCHDILSVCERESACVCGSGCVQFLTYRLLKYWLKANESHFFFFFIWNMRYYILNLFIYLCIFIFLHCTFGHVLSCFPADARCCCFHAYGEMKRLFLSREFPRIGPSILFDFSKWITYETYQYNNNNNLKKA